MSRNQGLNAGPIGYIDGVTISTSGFATLVSVGNYGHKATNCPYIYGLNMIPVNERFEAVSTSCKGGQKTTNCVRINYSRRIVAFFKVHHLTKNMSVEQIISEYPDRGKELLNNASWLLKWETVLSTHHVKISSKYLNKCHANQQRN